jgi:hypothetical protein
MCRAGRRCSRATWVSNPWEKVTRNDTRAAADQARSKIGNFSFFVPTNHARYSGLWMIETNEVHDSSGEEVSVDESGCFPDNLVVS